MASLRLPLLPEGPELRLLILGRTGGGKSRTGNSIMEEKCFQSSGKSTSVTQIVLAKEKQVGGRKLVLVDTPGTMDTENLQKPIEEISSSIVKSPEGYDAFILVLKYGERLTDEQHQAIEQLEHLFGEEFGKFAILLMTGGDTFENDHEDDGLSFEEYIERERYTSSRRSISVILQRIRGGAVLFNNFEKDPVSKRKQTIELIKKVDELRMANSGNRYTNEFFEKAKEELNKNKTEAQVTEEVKQEIKEKKDCFPAGSSVIKYPGVVANISSIVPGDMILCGGKNGEVSYQEVYMLGHEDYERTMKIVKITTRSRILQVSPGHYIPVGETAIYKLAKDIKIGESLYVLDESNGSTVYEEVTSLDSGFAQGCFNPFTMNGTIFVDGILATCYERSGPRPDVSHFLMGAMRGLYHVNSKWLRKLNESKKDGVPSWAWKISQIMK